MIKGLIIDLDGTVYLWDKEVDGAGDFIRRMNERGISCLFVTNRANRSPEAIRDQLQAFNIECDVDDILTSGQATVQYLGEGSVYCVGEEPLKEEFRESGMVVTEDSPDYVVVSFDRTFDFAKLEKACMLINAGAKFIATNPDKALKLDRGVSPGTGAIIAAVEAGSGKAPLVIGKPERLIVDMALKKMCMGPDEVLMLGDNVWTDVAAGEKAGVMTILILTGITKEAEITEAGPQPNWIVRDYAGLNELMDRIIEDKK